MSMGESTHSQVTDGIAIVAAVAGTSTTQTQSRALSLDVTEALAMITLLRLGSAGHWAFVRLVIRLLA